MIEYITGNWFRRWSSNEEAGTRVCRVENLLSDKRYKLAEHSPVGVHTDRIVLDDEMLQDQIWDKIAKIVGKTDSSHAGNLHGLIWSMRNLKPSRYRNNYPNLSFNDFYNPGEIEVRYETHGDNGKHYNFVELTASTVLPNSGSSLDYCSDSNRVLFNLGNTERLIVKVVTSDDGLCRELLSTAHKK